MVEELFVESSIFYFKIQERKRSFTTTAFEDNFGPWNNEIVDKTICLLINCFVPAMTIGLLLTRIIVRKVRSLASYLFIYLSI